KDIEYYNVVDKQNPRRVLRALEVIAVSGEPFSNFRKKNGKGHDYRKLNYLLEMDREQLYHRINYRVETMINQGLLEEVKNLMPYQNLKALQTVGYTELFDYLEGKHNLETAVELIKRNSRRYAKRQMTWFRKYGNWKVFRL
nr:tRNA dimethylallyltransferase [Saprospiraceae bacterium]